MQCRFDLSKPNQFDKLPQHQMVLYSAVAPNDLESNLIHICNSIFQNETELVWLDISGKLNYNMFTGKDFTNQNIL